MVTRPSWFGQCTLPAVIVAASALTVLLWGTWLAWVAS